MHGFTTGQTPFHKDQPISSPWQQCKVGTVILSSSFHREGNQNTGNSSEWLKSPKSQNQAWRAQGAGAKLGNKPVLRPRSFHLAAFLFGIWLVPAMAALNPFSFGRRRRPALSSPEHIGLRWETGWLGCLQSSAPWAEVNVTLVTVTVAGSRVSTGPRPANASCHFEEFLQLHALVKGHGLKCVVVNITNLFCKLRWHTLVECQSREDFRKQGLWLKLLLIRPLPGRGWGLPELLSRGMASSSCVNSVR